MAEARLQSEWDRTASLLAKIHNVNCSKTSDMIRDPAALNPLRAPKVPKMSLKTVRKMMTGRD